MGKLFWKFFLLFWLAQVFTSIGVGLSIWAIRSNHSDISDPIVKQKPLHEERRSQHSDDLKIWTPPPPFGEKPPELDGFFPPLLPLVAGGIVSLFFAVFLAWYFARPIRSLHAAFNAVAGGNLHTRIGASMAHRKDEMADLGQDFDNMTSKLQEVMESQKRLLHDISHEIRSPLARLQAAIDLIQQQPNRAGELTSRLEQDTQRINTLIDELLTFARLDSGVAGKIESQVDLIPILTQIVNDARFESMTKRCTIHLESEDEVFVKGNRELLFRACENVVRNAVQHSPENNQVSITVSRTNSERCIIQVSDSGTGILQEDLKSIFNPFFRSNSNNFSNGFGLGLAITQRVVQAHYGVVTAENKPDGGLLVTITLPVNK